MKIAVGAHVGEAIPPPIYFNHCSVIALWAKKYDLTMIGTWRQKVAKARCAIVDAAIGAGCSNLLLLDSDHLLPDEALDLLVENADAAVVSGLVCKRYFPFETVAFQFTDDREIHQCIVGARDKVLEVGVCAMGCTLVNLDILKSLYENKKLNKPFFYDAHFRSDMNFCMNLKKLGQRILLDTRIDIGHLGDPPVITPSNAQANRERYIEAGNRMEANDESSD